MTSKLRPRAVLYLRQSTYREESISLEVQEHACREHARRMGYDVVTKLEDPGISGRTWNRPAVQQVMRMIEEGDVDRIILWKWSRLSRNRYDWPAARKIVETAGGRIESATEPNDTETPEGRLMLDQMISYAVYESDKIGSTWREAHARRHRNGLPHSGQVRFGYAKAEDRSFVIDPETAPVLADMYGRYLAGEGFTRIARTVNDAGHRTVQGNLWSRVTVTQALDSGFGAGMLVQRGKGPQGRTGEATFTPGAHEPIIDLDTWEAYKAKRALTPLPPRVIEPKYWLTGLMRCGDCSGSMFVLRTGQVDSYVCGRARTHHDVPAVQIRRELVERYVEEWLRELAGNLTALVHAQARATQRKIKAADDRSVVEGKLTAIDQRMAALTVKWLDGDLPDSAYQATVAKLDRDRVALEARKVVDTREASVEYEIRQMAITLADSWEDLTVLEKRNTLGALIDRVTISPPVRQGTGVWRERIYVTPAWEAAPS